jgi:predicted SAM-dependent methyltransferase
MENFGERMLKSDHPANQEYLRFINHFINKGGLMLDIGCGNSKVHPDFVGIDPYVESDDVQIKAYMWDTPFEDNSVDLIVCNHALEHVSKFYVVPTLKEFERILKPGGALGVLVPNLMWCISLWAENQTNGFEMDLIFGNQLHDGEVHKTGFTVDLIKNYFSETPKLQLLNIYDVNGYTQWGYGIISVKGKNA